MASRKGSRPTFRGTLLLTRAQMPYLHVKCRMDGHDEEVYCASGRRDSHSTSEHSVEYIASKRLSTRCRSSGSLVMVTPSLHHRCIPQSTNSTAALRCDYLPIFLLATVSVLGVRFRLPRVDGTEQAKSQQQGRVWKVDVRGSQCCECQAG